MTKVYNEPAYPPALKWYPSEYIDMYYDLRGTGEYSTDKAIEIVKETFAKDRRYQRWKFPNSYN